MTDRPTIVLSCGEMSGDLHAGRLVTHLRERLPRHRVVAFGGERCAQAGAELLFHYREYAILGFTGVLASLPRLWRLERALRSRLRAADLFIGVDYPGLNLRLAAHARRLGVPVLYYISPQVWAWGAGRIPKMARVIDKLAVILPFEEAFFRARGVSAEFVGHPLVVDETPPEPVPWEAREGVGLLPGSRAQEVARILPVQLGAAAHLAARGSADRFVIGRSPAVPRATYERIVVRSGVAAIIDDDAAAVIRRSRLALVASGTATLQTALMETPLVVVYRVSPLNYWLARGLVTVDDIGLVNVVLGKRVAPELVQGAATPSALAAAAATLLDDEAQAEAMRVRFRGLRALLGGGRGSARVAEMAAELVGA
jgi:lipid-A-disaccharide synthase